MDSLKRRFDRCFGITPFFRNNDTWIYFVSLIATIICMVLYAQQLDENYDLTYGGVLFILIMVDIGSNLSGEKTIWHDESRFERLLQEVFRIVFIFIIPVLSLNQFLKSDLSFSLLALIFVIPSLYCIPFTRMYMDRKCLYVRLIKANMLLNLLISIRTTFFGILSAVCILFAWALRNKRMNMVILFVRVLTAYLVYVTLCIVAIPRCSIPCNTCLHRDPCAPTEEACNYFRNYYNNRYGT